MSYPPIPPSEHIGVSGLAVFTQQPQPPGGVYDPNEQQQQPMYPLPMDVEKPAQYNNDNPEYQPDPVEPISHRFETPEKYVVPVFVSFCVGFSWLAMYVAQLAICASIGEAQAWLWSILWVVVGNAIFCAILAALSLFLYSFLPYSTDRKSVFWFGVWTAIVVIATGLPYARTASQAQSARTYLTNQREVSCWKPVSDSSPAPLTSDNTNFVTFVEAKWVVDYRPWKQKMSTQVGTPEDEDADNRYNYCVAPVAYVGVVPQCPFNFYAACYVGTTKHSAASCSATDAALCGWDLNSASVVMQTIAQNGEFYNFGEPEDDSNWKTAMGYAGPKQSYQYDPLLVAYASDGPEFMDTAKTNAENSLFLQKAILVTFYAFTVIIYLLLSVFGFGDVGQWAKGFQMVLLVIVVIIAFLVWVALEIL